MGSFENAIIPRIKGSKVELFYGPGVQVAAVTATNWKPYTLPKNATMAMLVCLGGGAGGAGGFTGATSTGRGGGGGGGSGAVARLMIPTFFLPKTLFLLPGMAGSATAPGFTGIVGGRSFIADKPTPTVADTILVSGAAASAGGTAAIATGSSGGGAAETLSTNVLGIYTGFGIFVAIAGVAGTASGALGAAGVALGFGSAGVPLTGGTGGGSASATNVDGAGGNITGAGLVPTIVGGAAGGTAGKNGTNFGSPFIGTGGTGGGSSSAGTGGQGGKGAVGCGGAGGGGGITGGNGGDGGVGLIMIVTW